MNTIFIVQGYEIRDPNLNLGDVCTIEVYAQTEKEALKKAKNYIKKKFYRVSNIIEKDK